MGADRRVRRTRDRLHDALISLILEKGYDRTTVQDILDRADVGRSTFYAHYSSKDQLLLSGLADLRVALEAEITARSGPDTGEDAVMAPLLPLFQHAAGRRPLFRALTGGRGSALAVRAGRAMLSEVIADRLRTRLDVRDEPSLDLAVAFLVNGLLGLLTWWIEHAPHVTAEEMLARFERLATEGVPQLLQNEG